MELNTKLGEIESSVIRKVFEKCNTMEDTINLSLGEPDLPTPRVIVEDSVDYMLRNQLSYPKAGGIEELKEEVAKFYNSKYSCKYDKDNVLVTVGATEGLSTALRGILNAGDEVILVKPVYPLYPSLMTMLGVSVKYIDATKTDYVVKASQIEEAITPKTKAIILNYPSNPCGTMLSRTEVEEIERIAIENDIFVVSDEIYSELVFDRKRFNSFGEVAKGRDNFIIINGFSKSHSMTGWRLGYILASKKIRTQLLKVNQYTVSTAPTISQIGGVIALSKARNIDENLKIYSERANLVYKKFKEMGFNPVKPEGTLYLMADYKGISNKESLDFVMELLEETGVALVPGVAFGVEGNVRVSYTKPIRELEEACRRIEEYVNKR